MFQMSALNKKKNPNYFNQLLLLGISNAIIEDVNQIQEIYAYHVLNGLGTFEEEPPSVNEMINRYNKITQQKITFMLNRIFGKNISTSMLRHIFLSFKFGDIDLKQLQDTVASLLVGYIKMMMESKHTINLSYENVMDRVFKLKEKEKVWDGFVRKATSNKEIIKMLTWIFEKILYIIRLIRG